MQDSGLVCWNLYVLDEVGVAPDAQAVVGEARAANNLLVRGGPLEGGDLAASVNAVGASTGRRVPEVDHAVVGTTASGEEV